MIVTSGEGIGVRDEDGKSYIEGLAGLWCASLGFSEERLVEAAERQLRELPYYHSFFGRAPVPTAKLAEFLSRITPDSLTKFFFACSGSEAIDSAIKMVWYYNNAISSAAKEENHFSVELLSWCSPVAGASMTRIRINQEGFDLPIERFVEVDCPHYYRFAMDGETEEEFSARMADRLEQTILEEGPDTIAAFFAEPIQGAVDDLAVTGLFRPDPTDTEEVRYPLRRR